MLSKALTPLEIMVSGFVAATTFERPPVVA
jgi:hypothetical protein